MDVETIQTLIQILRDGGPWGCLALFIFKLPTILTHVKDLRGQGIQALAVEREADREARHKTAEQFQKLIWDMAVQNASGAKEDREQFERRNERLFDAVVAQTKILAAEMRKVGEAVTAGACRLGEGEEGRSHE